MRAAFLLLILILLVGCGAAPTGTEQPTSGSQPTSAGESEQATEVSQPTATSEAEQDTEAIPPTETTEQATEVSQPEATTSPSPSSEDVLATWSRSGGIAGLNDVLTVFEDGTLQLEQRGATRTGQASADDIQRLQQTLESDEWQGLENRYGRQTPDAFHYTIEAQGKTVETFDGSDNPQVLTDLLEQFRELYETVSN